MDKPGVIGVDQGPTVRAVPISSGLSAPDFFAGSFGSPLVFPSGQPSLHPHGCFGHGLGRDLGRQDSPRRVVSPSDQVEHQRERAQGNCTGNLELGSTVVGQVDSDLLRQRCRGCYDQEEGISMRPSPVPPCSGAGRGVPSVSSEGSGFTCGRGEECRGRFSVTSSPPAVGVEPLREGVRVSLSEVGSSGGGLMCHPGQCEDGSFRLAPTDRRVLGLPHTVVGPLESPLRVSAYQASDALRTTSRATQCSSDSGPGVPLVGEEALVSAAPQPLASGGTGSSSPVPGTSGPVAASPGSGVLPSQSEGSQAARGPFIRAALESRGWSAESISVAEGALRVSSCEVYERHWREFVEWISAKGFSPRSVSLAAVVDFLRFLRSDRKLVLSTIRSYVSAIRYPLQLAKGSDLFDDPSYAAFMRGLAASMPISRPVPVQWNLNVVLSFLQGVEPLSSVSSFALLKKTLFLVALASGRRISELTHLSWKAPFLVITHSSAKLAYTPGFLAKNEVPGRLHSRIVIRRIACSSDSPERYLCPVRCLLHWRQRIRDRGSVAEQQLFQSPDAVFQSPKRLSSLLVEVIKESHSVVSEEGARLMRVRAHDVRAVAASQLWLSCSDWDQVSSAFSWKDKTVFIDHYSRGISALEDLRRL